MDLDKLVLKKKKTSKKPFIALFSVVALLLFGTGIIISSFVSKNQTIKKADAFISMDKFEEGISIYENVLSSGTVPAIVIKRESAIKLMESKDNYEKGIEAFDNDNIGKAVKYLSKVPATDVKRYSSASNKLDELEDTAVLLVEDYIDNGDLNEASKLVIDYLRSSPDSEAMKNAKDTIASKRSEAENQAKAKESKPQEQIIKVQQVEKIVKESDSSVKDKAQAKRDIVAQNKAENAASTRRENEEATQLADSLIGTNQIIISEEANLRQAPTLNSDIITVIGRGSSVYISDTKVESSNRIWCRTMDDYGDGWISYNTMNYSMQ